MSKQYTKEQAFVVFSLNKLQESLDGFSQGTACWRYARLVVGKAEKVLYDMTITKYEQLGDDGQVHLNTFSNFTDSPFNEDPLDQGITSYQFSHFNNNSFTEALDNEDFVEKAAVIICNAAVQVGLISFVESMSEMEHGGTVGVVVHSALVNNNAEKGKDNMLISASKIVVNGLDKNVEDALRASHLDYLSRPDLNESVVN